MKKLCENAGVEPEKVFPHNLRHLFARTYYSIEKDISRLADILGHSNIDTTRIYTCDVYRRELGIRSNVLHCACLQCPGDLGTFLEYCGKGQKLTRL